MLNISKLSLIRNDDLEANLRLSTQELRTRLLEQAEHLAEHAMDPRENEDADEVLFKEFEETIGPMVFALACTAIMLFLAACEERVRQRLPTRLEKQGRSYQRDRAKPRTLETWFGPVRYWRTYYVTRKGQGGGWFPLDAELGLLSDRISLNLLAVAVRMATKLSFAESRDVLGWFLPMVPAVTVIEQATLGLGRYTDEWFESAPPPEGDGDVLVMLFDSKGSPMVTEQELAKRRGKRKKRPKAPSPRHRGREKRGRHGSKKRRKKGDKSKNAKMATLVVMYTLKTEGRMLLGPINPWVYASFAPNKHAFAIAWREARKRGFDPDGDDVIQIVTDGDPDLARYANYFFPNAIHTLDVIHVIEKLWEIAPLIHREGSEELTKWVEKQKERLYNGHVSKIIKELREHLALVPKTGPGTKNRRERLSKLIGYLDKRVEMMNYAELVDEDLEIGSGAVEGAVKYVIGKRCDQGGMRWIPEKNEAVLQLRCIEVNGDWNRFIDHVKNKIQQQSLEEGHLVRLQQKTPSPLPDLLDKPSPTMSEAA